ncbi:hypothetical protein ACFQZT_19470 [Paenibacillus sp. GCM10027628]|uniref:hypothetical protein n=1 Tax=Paenibacillus sp. GCM10027628 TaxID=3273413 RepID=UPI00363D1684
MTESIKENTIEMIEEILIYINRARKNRDIIEQYYFEQKFEAAKIELDNLFEGVVWIEYAGLQLGIPNSISLKDPLFDGIKEALEKDDWLTLIDFISYQYKRYLDIIEITYWDKYNEMKGRIG